MSKSKTVKPKPPPTPKKVKDPRPAFKKEEWTNESMQTHAVLQSQGMMNYWKLTGLFYDKYIVYFIPHNTGVSVYGLDVVLFHMDRPSKLKKFTFAGAVDVVKIYSHMNSLTADQLYDFLKD